MRNRFVQIVYNTYINIDVYDEKTDATKKTVFVSLFNYVYFLLLQMERGRARDKRRTSGRESGTTSNAVVFISHQEVECLEIFTQRIRKLAVSCAAGK